MTYFEAESMRQEFIVAMQYRDMFPERMNEVAMKYNADQWVECGKTILEKIEEQKITLFELLGLVELIRKAA